MASYAQWGNSLYSGKRSYNIVGARRYFLGVGFALILVSMVCLAIFHLNPGIEFKGGVQYTVTNAGTNPDQKLALAALREVDAEEGARVFQAGTEGLQVQTKVLDSADSTKLAEALTKAYSGKAGADSVASVTKEAIGPTWGQAVSRQATIGLLIFIALIALLMIAYFRTWTMALSALVALSHDFFITIGVYAITQIEVTPATIIGFLTILGYSLYDTVVVFDKIRENTLDYRNQSRFKYSELVNLSINQTMVRSINTSVVAILPVSAILFIGTYFLGGGTLRDIAMPLFIGMIVGTFSSIFIASPLLTWFMERNQKVVAHNAKVDKARAARNENASEDSENPVTTPQTVVSPLTPGSHQGQAAQPKRKKAKKK